MEEVINLAAELGVIRAEYETDAMLLVSALNNRAHEFSSEARIIEDLKIQSRTWLSTCSFKFSRRCTNTVAHVITQVGARCDANDAVMADLAQTIS
jgi:hypothetical protein